VKKWEIELQALRESNARLTSALQESTASVEQWKRQFSICRDENDRLRSKVGHGGRPGCCLCPLPPCHSALVPEVRRKTCCLPPE
jgi:hypothetical protein